MSANYDVKSTAECRRGMTDEVAQVHSCEGQLRPDYHDVFKLGRSGEEVDQFSFSKSTTT